MHHIFILDRGGSSSLEKELTFFCAQIFLLPFDFFNSILQESSLDKYSWMKILSFTQSDAILRDETIVLWCFVLCSRCLLSKRLSLLSNTGWLKAASKQKTGCRVTIDINPCLRWNQWIFAVDSPEMCFVYPPTDDTNNSFFPAEPVSCSWAEHAKWNLLSFYQRKGFL